MENHPDLKHFSPVIFNNMARLLTWEQRGIAWFLCRYGMVSSTTAGKMMHTLGQLKMYSPQTFSKLSSSTQRKVIDVLDLCGYKFKPMDVTEQQQRVESLCKQSKQQIIEKANSYGLTGVTAAQTKEVIANKIVQHEVQHGTHQVETDVQNFFIKNNFMFPLRKKALTLGLLNEPEVIAALPYFLQNASEGLGNFTVCNPGKSATCENNNGTCLCIDLGYLCIQTIILVYQNRDC